MADIDKLSDEIKLTPNADDERHRARLAVAERALREPLCGTLQRESLGLYLDMLALWPGQEEHAPRYLSSGRLTNSTMLKTADARRRAGL